MVYEASTDATTHKEKTQPTTVRLPGSLLDEAKELLASGVTNIGTMSALIADALEAYIRMLRKQQIDHAFLVAGKDGRYRKLSREVNEMFAISDRESVSIEDRQTVSASARHP
jgi:hypothetical protein